MINLTENAIEILENRYLMQNEQGKVIETPAELFQRVAKAVAQAELSFGGAKAVKKWEERFYHLMSSLAFLPNSPTLMNAGRPKGQLSACFVLPMEDSLESILSTLKNAALIHQSGGGTGFSFSKLRPKDDVILTTGGTSSGPVSFIKIFDATTEHIKQGGRRRGANMGILKDNHPDIEAFIQAKSDPKILQNFNLSVMVTDEFMQAVQQNKDWALINPRTQKTVKILKATYLWDLIITQAWNSGEPGLLFLDTINRTNPTPITGRLNATNPCGEMPLLDYESCNLGSINLSKMLYSTGETRKVDWTKLEQTIQIAIRFLDNVIEVNHYILPEIKTITLANRKIGLGVMGWAEMLIELNTSYASEEAVQLGEQLMKFIKETAQEASAKLATEKGTFPAWQQSIYAPDQPMRNATCTSIAPTGTISIIAGTSSSIEPLFAVAYRRVGILDNQTQLEINRLFIEKAKKAGIWSESLVAKIYEKGSIQPISEIPKRLKKLFITSLEIAPDFHLRHLMAFQKHTDNAVSKTINLRESATKKMVENAFYFAWKNGIKGVTVYRYGSRRKQVLQK